MKTYILFFTTLFSVLSLWSKSNDVIEVQICYATYDGTNSHVMGRHDAYLPNDSVVSMVYNEYNMENLNEKEGLYVAGKDSLYFFSDNIKESWYVGDISRIQLSAKYLVVQQIKGFDYSFKLLDLSSQEWSGERNLYTTHFHQFVGIRDYLFLSYVQNDGGEDYMLIKKYKMPSMEEEVGFQYTNLSWEHITISFSENAIYAFESFSKVLTKLDTNGSFLKDTTFPNAYEFVSQEIGYKDDIHYLKNYAGDLFSFTEAKNVFTMENLGNQGEYYLLDENLFVKHLMSLKKGLSDEISSSYPYFSNVEERNIISFCSFIFLPTGLSNESFTVEKSTTCYTLNALRQEDFIIHSVYTLDGQTILFNREAKQVDQLHLEKGMYVLGINADTKKYRTARLLVE